MSEPQSRKQILFWRKCIKPYRSGVFGFMLMKFSFCTPTYLLLEFSDYKYYRKSNFLSGYNSVTDINVAADLTAEIYGTKFQRNLTLKYSK